MGDFIAKSSDSDAAYLLADGHAISAAAAGDGHHRCRRVGGCLAGEGHLAADLKLGQIQLAVCYERGVAQVLTKAALPTPSEMLARLVFWVLWITFILFGLEALQIPALQEEISGLFRVLPQIFVALVILFAGVLIANFVSRATLLAAVNANSPSPRLISAVVRFVIIALTVTMALERVGLGRGVVLIAFSTFFGAIMFGLALAFGLGGRDLARRLLERRFLEEKKEEDQGISHL